MQQSPNVELIGVERLAGVGQGVPDMGAVQGVIRAVVEPQRPQLAVVLADGGQVDDVLVGLTHGVLKSGAALPHRRVCGLPVLVVGGDHIELGRSGAGQVFGGYAPGVGPNSGVGHGEHRRRCPDDVDAVRAEAHRRPERFGGGGVVAVEHGEPPRVAHDHPGRVLVVDPGGFDHLSATPDGQRPVRYRAAVDLDDLVERTAGGQPESDLGHHGVAVAVGDRLTLGAGEHLQGLAGLEPVATGLLADPRRLAERAQTLVVPAQLGQHSLGVAGAVAVDRHERRRVDLRLGSAAIAAQTRAQRAHEDGGSHTLGRLRIRVVPSLVAVSVHRLGVASSNMVGVDDVFGCHLAQIGDRLVVGDQSRLQQRVLERGESERHIPGVDQRRRPLSEPRRLAEPVGGGREHLDGGSHDLEPDVQGPFVLGQGDQRRVERVAPLHLIDEIRRGRA